MAVNVNRCVICYTIIDSSSCGGTSSNDNCFTENDHFLSKDLHVIFLLRNLFEVSREKLQTYLTQLGNPSDLTFLNFCKGCGEAVENAKRIYQEALEALRIFKAVRGEIVETVKRSWRRHNGKVKDQNFNKMLATQNLISGEDMAAKLVDETREFICKHDYGPSSDPFETGDLIAVDRLRSSLRPSPPPQELKIDPERFVCESLISEEDEHAFLDDQLEDSDSSSTGNLFLPPIDLKIEVQPPPILETLLRKDHNEKQRAFSKKRLGYLKGGHEVHPNRCISAKPQKSAHPHQTGSKMTNSHAPQLKKPSFPKLKQKRPPSKAKYKCDYKECGKVFVTNFSLRAHLMRHTGEKPFKCSWPECTWKFTRVDVLRRHYIGHFSTQLYNCDFCTSSYNRPDNLRRHIDTCHKS